VKNKIANETNLTDNIKINISDISFKNANWIELAQE
jgi:hypothetical protein